MLGKIIEVENSLWKCFPFIPNAKIDTQKLQHSTNNTWMWVLSLVLFFVGFFPLLLLLQKRFPPTERAIQCFSRKCIQFKTSNKCSKWNRTINYDPESIIHLKAIWCKSSIWNRYSNFPKIISLCLVPAMALGFHIVFPYQRWGDNEKKMVHKESIHLSSLALRSDPIPSHHVKTFNLNIANDYLVILTFSSPFSSFHQFY